MHRVFEIFEGVFSVYFATGNEVLEVFVLKYFESTILYAPPFKRIVKRLIQASCLIGAHVTSITVLFHFYSPNIAVRYFVFSLNAFFNLSPTSSKSKDKNGNNVVSSCAK